MLIDVGMCVDHAGQDEFAGYIDNVGGRGVGNGGANRCDVTLSDGDVKETIHVLGRIDHPPAL
jgi:hypothetical protein